MKSYTLRVFIVFFLFGVVVPDVSYAGLSLDKVLGIWLFDEGAGTTAKGSSGNGNDAEEAIKGPKWANGKFGKGLKFEQKGWYDCDNPVMTQTVSFAMGWDAGVFRQKNKRRGPTFCLRIKSRLVEVFPLSRRKTMRI